MIYEEIKCSSKQTLLYFGFCMTYDNVTETTEYTKCPYVAEYPTADEVYIKLPQNVSLLNDFMCGPLNWEGTLCGRCKPEYGPAVYSVLPVWDWGIQYHLCSTHRGLRWWLSSCHGSVAAQAIGVLGLTPADCQAVHFPLFLPHNINLYLQDALRKHTIYLQ